MKHNTKNLISSGSGKLGVCGFREQTERKNKASMVECQQLGNPDILLLPPPFPFYSYSAGIEFTRQASAMPLSHP